MGDEFRSEVDDALRRIIAAPDRPAPCYVHDRSARLRRFPDRLDDRILDPDNILILAVAHDRRRPGYWSRRSPI